MVAVTVTIPHMLAALVGGERKHSLDADTVYGALQSLFERHALLRIHVFDEAGELRPHVSCFHNGTMVAEDTAVADGDEITVLQAVSGG